MVQNVFIGLGSNLQHPEVQIQQAITELDTLQHTSVIKSSKLYNSSPMGPQDQPDFINAVARIDTTLVPQELLYALQDIENCHLRERTQHWGPRTLDLDILLYANEVINTPHLIIPHAGLIERDFVLYPLYEISPDLVMPVHGELKKYIKKYLPEGLSIHEF